MGSKTVVLSPKSNGEESHGATATLGIQSDTAFNEATKQLSGRDLCSIADFTVDEMAAVMEHCINEIRAIQQKARDAAPGARAVGRAAPSTRPRG